MGQSDLRLTEHDRFTQISRRTLRQPSKSIMGQADFFHCGTRYKLVRSDVVVASASRQDGEAGVASLCENRSAQEQLALRCQHQTAYLQTSMVERQV